MNNQHI